MKIKQIELEKMLAKQENLASYKAHNIIESLKSIITEILTEGDEVTLTTFGKFETFTRYERGGVNPRNPKEKIVIPSTRVAKFRAGRNLKNSIKKHEVS